MPRTKLARLAFTKASLTVLINSLVALDHQCIEIIKTTARAHHRAPWRSSVAPDAPDLPPDVIKAQLERQAIRKELDRLTAAISETWPADELLEPAKRRRRKARSA